MNIQRMNLLAITPYHYAKRVEMNLTNKFVENYYELHEWRIAMILNQYRSWKLDNENVRAILADCMEDIFFPHCRETAAKKQTCHIGCEKNGAGICLKDLCSGN